MRSKINIQVNQQTFFKKNGYGPYLENRRANVKNNTCGEY